MKHRDGKIDMGSPPLDLWLWNLKLVWNHENIFWYHQNFACSLDHMHAQVRYLTRWKNCAVKSKYNVKEAKKT